MKRAARLLASVTLVLAAAFVPAAQAGAAPGPGVAPQWWFDNWNINGLWARGVTGAGMTIAVIDTGVQASIPELAGKVLPGTNLNGRAGDGTTDYEVDEFGHGTAMASLMVASAGYANIQGIAPDARVLPIAVPLSGSAGAEDVTEEFIDDAIRWAVDNGAKVISMSLGGFMDPKHHPVPCPKVTQDAVIYAIEKGAVVLAASGNSGEEGSPVEAPGVCLGVISVGAVDASLSVPSFSSRHPYLTVTAPGKNIPTLSRVAGEAYIGEGTSQATALASAALSLVWSANPDLSNKDVVSKFLASAEDLGAPGRDSDYGLGFIHPDLAIDLTPAPTNPVWEGVEPYLTQPESESPPPAEVNAPPAAEGTDPPGEVAIGSPPPGTPVAVVGGAAVAAGSALMLAGLSVAGVRGRARRRAMAAAAASTPAAAAIEDWAQELSAAEPSGTEHPSAAELSEGARPLAGEPPQATPDSAPPA